MDWTVFQFPTENLLLMLRYMNCFITTYQVGVHDFPNCVGCTSGIKQVTTYVRPAGDWGEPYVQIKAKFLQFCRSVLCSECYRTGRGLIHSWFSVLKYSMWLGIIFYGNVTEEQYTLACVWHTS